MEKRNEFKTINITNCAGYYFYDIINGTDIGFSNILLDKNLHENVSVYRISYKTSASPKPLRFRFDEIDWFIIIIDGKMKHLILFDYRLFNKDCHHTNYLISKKSGITNRLIHVIFHLLKKYWLFIML